jgi:hypothetical protein
MDHNIHKSKIELKNVSMCFWQDLLLYTYCTGKIALNGTALSAVGLGERQGVSWANGIQM